MWLEKSIYWLLLLPISIFLGTIFGGILFFAFLCLTGSSIMAWIGFFSMLIFALIFTPRIWFEKYPIKYDEQEK